MKRRNLFTIENKILIPFVAITLVAIAGLFVVFYQMEYKIKLESEDVNAQALVAYINSDIDAGGYWKNPADLLEKYEVRRCFYGHLHGASHGLAMEGIWDGIEFRLVSADRLGFRPYLVMP